MTPLLVSILLLGSFAVSDPCSAIDSFEPGASVDWYVVNDGVMGGRSLGGIELGDGGLVFEGAINTNGGGFSSIRRGIEPGALQGVRAIKLRVTGDGRSYRLTFRTDARRFGRAISYQVAIPEVDGPADLEVGLSEMRTSIFGRQVDAPPFDPAKVEELGIILADGQDGSFRLVIQQIDACR